MGAVVSRVPAVELYPIPFDPLTHRLDCELDEGKALFEMPRGELKTVQEHARLWELKPSVLEAPRLWLMAFGEDERPNGWGATS